VNPARLRVRTWRRVAGLLATAGVRYWLSNGTALGAVRDGDFIASDADIDLGIWPDDQQRMLDAFARRGYLPRKIRPTHVFVAAPVTIDIKVHTYCDDGARVYYKIGKRQRIRYEFDAHLFEDLRPIELHGIRTLVPSPPEEYLAAHYGPDWRTPRDGWNWRTDPACIVPSRG
jgi:phosphorylcholine metabolism protein LicD